MDEMGCTLVEVTAHMGARPDHAAWQGKVYRWNRNAVVSAQTPAAPKHKQSESNILTKSGKSAKLNSKADPMAEVFGPGEISHPTEIAEYRKELAEAGVRLIERKKESLGYTPALTSGKPGTAYVSKGASYSAWTHEMQHMRDDRAAGWIGMRVIADPNQHYEWEVRAYNLEIEMATKAGRKDIAERLRENLEKERREIYGE